MADTTTPNFGLTKPQIGSSRDSWGDKLNGNLDIIDTQIKSAQTVAGAALPKAGGTVTGEIMRQGEGVVIHWVDPALAHGGAALSPAGGSDPTVNPGDIWFGY